MADNSAQRTRRWCVHGALLSLLVFACNEPQRADSGTSAGALGAPVSFSDSVFGVVSARNDTTCLRVVPGSWQPTDTVLIMVPDDQRTIQATVREAIPSCTEAETVPDVRYFRLDAPDFQPGNLGVALLVHPMPVVNGARTDLDNDGTPESYRSCTSSEGLHLTVWNGEPLTGRRVWHYYHYLGYDVEPTCVKADYTER